MELEEPDGWIRIPLGSASECVPRPVHTRQLARHGTHTHTHFVPLVSPSGCVLGGFGVRCPPGSGDTCGRTSFSWRFYRATRMGATQ